MKLYRVITRYEAYVDYETWVSAETADEAVQTARRDESRFIWNRLGTVEFDIIGSTAMNDDREDRLPSNDP